MLEFEISPLAFYQVNSAQMEKLYDKVLEYADFKGHETVLDIYCGIGTIGLWCAKKAKKVIGIESNKDAILNANRNAVINGIVNAHYICGKAEIELSKLVCENAAGELSDIVNNEFSADVVILDPPRAGCKPELLNAVAKTNAERIIYVSCDIATQARDIKILSELGYEFIEATPVDMFPWSLNVESVVLLSK
jgi:23S rRNA (uracil1939-C5)-methyltransferase